MRTTSHFAAVTKQPGNCGGPIGGCRRPQELQRTWQVWGERGWLPCKSVAHQSFLVSSVLLPPPAPLWLPASEVADAPGAYGTPETAGEGRDRGLLGRGYNQWKSHLTCGDPSGDEPLHFQTWFHVRHQPTAINAHSFLRQTTRQLVNFPTLEMYSRNTSTTPNL